MSPSLHITSLSSFLLLPPLVQPSHHKSAIFSPLSVLIVAAVVALPLNRWPNGVILLIDTVHAVIEWRFDSVHFEAISDSILTVQLVMRQLESLIFWVFEMSLLFQSKYSLEHVHI
ncbi:hypothetical protein ACS0TY_011593 [Phlomoides rotata]